MTEPMKPAERVCQTEFDTMMSSGWEKGVCQLPLKHKGPHDCTIRTPAPAAEREGELPPRPEMVTIWDSDLDDNFEGYWKGDYEALEARLTKAEEELARVQVERETDKRDWGKLYGNALETSNVHMKSLRDTERTLARERELVRELRNHYQKVRGAGQRMSNLLYNLSQQKRFIEPDAALMKESVDEWDAAKIAADPAPKPAERKDK